MFVLLSKPETVFAATGQVTYSGTGRNARGTRHVAELNSYQAVPVKWQYQSAVGREMVANAEARFFAPYWSEFGMHSQYNTYLEGDGLKDFLVKTKSGNRIVGACIRKGRGALIAVPALVLDTDKKNETLMETSISPGPKTPRYSEKNSYQAWLQLPRHSPPRSRLRLRLIGRVMKFTDYRKKAISRGVSER